MEIKQDPRDSWVGRRRAPNFTPWENQLLKLLVKGLKDKLDNKKTDHASVVIKQQAWRDLTKEFNDRLGGNPYRTAKVLKHRYDNIRKNFNKNMRLMQQRPSNSEEDSLDAVFAISENNVDDLNGTTENIHIEVDMTEEDEDDEAKDELRKILDMDNSNGAKGKTISENDNSAAPFNFFAKPDASSTPEPTLEEFKKKLLMDEHELKMVQMKQKHTLEMELIREEHAERVSRLKQEHEAKMKFLEMQRRATLLNNL